MKTKGTSANPCGMLCEVDCRLRFDHILLKSLISKGVLIVLQFVLSKAHDLNDNESTVVHGDLSLKYDLSHDLVSSPQPISFNSPCVSYLF